MYLTSPSAFESMSGCEFFFIGVKYQPGLPFKLFSHGALKITGQAETDGLYFFFKKLRNVAILYFISSQN